MGPRTRRILIHVGATLLALLSAAAGAAKVMLVPEEAAFLAQFGLSEVQIIAFGALQIGGAILMVVPYSRMLGSALVTVSFLVSAGLLLAAGNLAFGAFSLLPAALAGLVGYLSARPASP